jgi:hypothetical protein
MFSHKRYDLPNPSQLAIKFDIGSLQDGTSQVNHRIAVKAVANFTVQFKEVITAVAFVQVGDDTQDGSLLPPVTAFGGPLATARGCYDLHTDVFGDRINLQFAGQLLPTGGQAHAIVDGTLTLYWYEGQTFSPTDPNLCSSWKYSNQNFRGNVAAPQGAVTTKTLQSTELTQSLGSAEVTGFRCKPTASDIFTVTDDGQTITMITTNQGFGMFRRVQATGSHSGLKLAQPDADGRVIWLANQSSNILVFDEDAAVSNISGLKWLEPHSVTQFVYNEGVWKHVI